MACTCRLMSLSCLTGRGFSVLTLLQTTAHSTVCFLNRVRCCVCSAVESRTLVCIKIVVAFDSIRAVYPGRGQLGAQGLVPNTGSEELYPEE